MLHRGAAAAHHAALTVARSDPQVDLVALERGKIKGAVRTDFILSAEIIAITLGTVAEAPFMTQVVVLVGVAVVMTVGVYGLVAGIVKLDDAGLFLSRVPGDSAAARAQRGVGRVLLWTAPWLMKALSIAGTAAMFLVGGGILAHGVAPIGHWIEALAHSLGGVAGALTPLLLNGGIGILAGALTLAAVSGVQWLLRRGGWSAAV